MPAEGHPHQPRRNKDGITTKQKFVGVSVCNLMALLHSIKVCCNTYFWSEISKFMLLCNRDHAAGNGTRIQHSVHEPLNHNTAPQV